MRAARSFIETQAARSVIRWSSRIDGPVRGQLLLVVAVEAHLVCACLYGFDQCSHGRAFSA